MSTFAAMRRIIDFNALDSLFDSNSNNVVGADIIARFTRSAFILIDSNHISFP
jgi:hypothetical protein